MGIGVFPPNCAFLLRDVPHGGGISDPRVSLPSRSHSTDEGLFEFPLRGKSIVFDRLAPPIPFNDKSRLLEVITTRPSIATPIGTSSILPKP